MSIGILSNLSNRFGKSAGIEYERLAVGSVVTIAATGVRVNIIAADASADLYIVRLPSGEFARYGASAFTADNVKESLTPKSFPAAASGARFARLLTAAAMVKANDPRRDWIIGRLEATQTLQTRIADMESCGLGGYTKMNLSLRATQIASELEAALPGVTLQSGGALRKPAPAAIGFRTGDEDAVYRARLRDQW